MSLVPVAVHHKPKLGGEGHFSYKSWKMAFSRKWTAVNRVPLPVVIAFSTAKADCNHCLWKSWVKGLLLFLCIHEIVISMEPNPGQTFEFWRFWALFVKLSLMITHAPLSGCPAPYTTSGSKVWIWKEKQSESEKNIQKWSKNSETENIKSAIKIYNTANIQKIYAIEKWKNKWIKKIELSPNYLQPKNTFCPLIFYLELLYSSMFKTITFMFKLVFKMIKTWPGFGPMNNLLPDCSIHHVSTVGTTQTTWREPTQKGRWVEMIPGPPCCEATVLNHHTTVPPSLGVLLKTVF